MTDSEVPGLTPQSAGVQPFPFTAVVGQEDAKLALMLVAVDPLIGGVLLRGEKGSAKTTLARGLAALLPDNAPFVELPLGATEDRLIGTLDVARALVDQEFAFTPGLLAKVDGGVLYVDEVNLLADHLVDTLLDVSVSGTNRVERDAVSHVHPSRFVLIGSMNPEEGELRPQLLDRFGLSVDVVASRDVAERTEAVRRRLAFDRDGQTSGHSASGHSASGHSASGHRGSGVSGPSELDGGGEQDDEGRLAARLVSAKPAEISDEIIEVASRLALAVGAEGLRADLVLCRSAAAHAGLVGRKVATEHDLRRVAPLVLAHRSRRNPFDPPMLPPDQIEEAMDDVLADQEPPGPGPDPEPTRTDDDDDESGAGGRASAMAVGADRTPPGDLISARRTMSTAGAAASGGRVRVESARGRLVRDVPADLLLDRPVAVVATVRQLAERRMVDPDASIELADVRHAVREQLAGALLILAVDVSGSMGATARAEAATGTALGLLTEAYQRRDHVSVVTFGGDGAVVALQPTGSVEVARNRLANLATGGPTPLAAGLRQALTVATSRRDASRQPLLVLLSDCRASGDQSELTDALHAAGEVARSGVAGLVLDCETGSPRLGLASRVAEAMGARCIEACDLDSVELATMIRSAAQELWS